MAHEKHPSPAGQPPTRALPTGFSGSRAGVPKRRGAIADYIDGRLASAKYVVTAQELESLHLPVAAQRASLRRLVDAGRLAKLGHRRGIWLIVPPEQRLVGAPQALWVLHDVMEALDASYYLGLRSAASMYGATHHALQAIHVVTSRRIADMTIGRTRVRFFFRRTLSHVPTRLLPNQVAPVWCSTAEATALDLVRYMPAVGGLHVVASTLSQCYPAMTTQGLRGALDALEDVPNAQRLGFLLSHVTAHRLAEVCATWLQERAPRPVLLEHHERPPHSDAPSDAPLDERWRVIRNAQPDASL